MKITEKQFIIDKVEGLNVDNIENIIRQSGFEPLRWAIVKADKDNLTIEAVILED